MRGKVASALLGAKYQPRILYGRYLGICFAGTKVAVSKPYITGLRPCSLQEEALMREATMQAVGAMSLGASAGIPGALI